MKILAQQAWEYTLYQKEERYLLSVVCGSAAIYELNVELNPEEVQNWEQAGISFIEAFSRKVRAQPQVYFPRRIQLPEPGNQTGEGGAAQH